MALCCIAASGRSVRLREICNVLPKPLVTYPILSHPSHVSKAEGIEASSLPSLAAAFFLGPWFRVEVAFLPRPPSVSASEEKFQVSELSPFRFSSFVTKKATPPPWAASVALDLWHPPRLRTTPTRLISRLSQCYKIRVLPCLMSIRVNALVLATMSILGFF